MDVHRITASTEVLAGLNSNGSGQSLGGGVGREDVGGV